MKRKTHNLNYLILAVSLLFSYSINAQWTQKGNDIVGNVAGEWSGGSVSMSSDGNTVAIGAIGNDEGRGSVRIFKLDEKVWTQKGNDIVGKATRDWLGRSVSMSSDGNTVAIGAEGNDDGGSEAGYVRIFEWKETKWEQKGDNINGPERSQSGLSVSMSSDGNIVAIGAPSNLDITGTSEGHVRIYEWKETEWEQKGGYIKAERELDSFGASVSMSSNGNTVAIGAYSNGEVGKDKAGHVRIHIWDGSAWIQKGNDIDGKAAGDYFGWSVSMSSDGNTVIIGAASFPKDPRNAKGYVSIFEWDGAWTQKGNDIGGEADGDHFGYSVSMSSDGNIVAIGATSYPDDLRNSKGYVSIFEWDETVWERKEIDIDGKADGDYFGTSVSMSSDRNIVAIGATGNDGSGVNTGHVRVFSFGPDVFSIEEKEKELSLSVYPNPTKGELHIELAEKGTCKIFSMIGQKVIKSIPLQKGRTTVDVSGINQGWYMLQIVSLEGKVRKNIKFRKE